MCSNSSDNVLINIKAHGLKPVVNISDKLDDKINLYGKKNPPHIRINRVFVICIYMMLDSFIYRIQILSSLQSHLQELLHQNTTSQKFATSRETYPVDLLPRREESSQLCFNQIIIQFPIVCTPSGTDMKYSLLSVMSKWADSQFKFLEISDSIQFVNYQSK